jgi:hypothetical protein
MAGCNSFAITISGLSLICTTRDKSKDKSAIFAEITIHLLGSCAPWSAIATMLMRIYIELAISDELVSGSSPPGIQNAHVTAKYSAIDRRLYSTESLARIFFQFVFGILTQSLCSIFQLFTDNLLDALSRLLIRSHQPPEGSVLLIYQLLVKFNLNIICHTPIGKNRRMGLRTKKNRATAVALKLSKY